MASTQSFSAQLEKWGRVYGVKVPTDVSVALGIGGHVPVAGRVNGKSFHTTLSPLRGARHRLLLNADARTAAKAGPGDTVDLVIQADPSNRLPPVPDDLAEAFDILVDARRRFDAWPASQRREILLWIAEGADPETRSRRIARAMARVMES